MFLYPRLRSRSSACLEAMPSKYIKKLIAKDMLGSVEASKNQEDVTSEREARTREVADVCNVMKSMQEWATDLESTVTQRFEARVCEMEAVTVRLKELKDVKFQLRYEIVNQRKHIEQFKGCRRTR